MEGDYTVLVEGDSPLVKILFETSLLNREKKKIKDRICRAHKSKLVVEYYTKQGSPVLTDIVVVLESEVSFKKFVKEIEAYFITTRKCIFEWIPGETQSAIVVEAPSSKLFLNFNANRHKLTVISNPDDNKKFLHCFCTVLNNIKGKRIFSDEIMSRTNFELAYPKHDSNAEVSMASEDDFEVDSINDNDIDYNTFESTSIINELDNTITLIGDDTHPAKIPDELSNVEVTSLKEHLAVFNTRLLNQMQSIQDSIACLPAVLQKVTALEEKFSTEIDRFSARVFDIETKFQSNEQRLAALEQENKRLKDVFNKIPNHKPKIDEISAKITNLAVKVNSEEAAKADAANVNEKVAALEKKIAAIESKVDKNLSNNKTSATTADNSQTSNSIFESEVDHSTFSSNVSYSNPNRSCIPKRKERGPRKDFRQLTDGH